MFFQDAIGKKLRFGDVLKGYLSTTPRISEPFDESGKEPYNIDVRVPEFSVVMDPCCHIGGGSISLTPLIQVKPHFWDTPCLTEDMTRINHKAMPKDLMHPVVWNRLPGEEKLQALSAIPDYGLRNYFIYKENSVFPPYDVKREMRYNEVVDSDSKLPKYEKIKEQRVITTRYYMINFKNIYHLNCEKISTIKNMANEEILRSICIQLSIKTRNALRDKMSFYFRNRPEEDRMPDV